MSRLRNLSLTLILLVSAFVLILSVLFYHVSAVLVLDQDRRDRFLNQIEVLHSIQNCEWISESVIQRKIITVQCESPLMGIRILHFDEKGAVVAGLNLDAVHYPMAKETFKTLTGITDYTMTLTYYDNDSVYWIQSGTQEWLMSMQDYSILWKVEKNNE